MRGVLAAAKPAEIPFVAIGAFAGLRPAEIARLDWSDVKFDKRIIEVSAEKAARRTIRAFVWIQPRAFRRGRAFS